MTEEREVNSPASEAEVVSPVAAPESTLIKCRTCQKDFPRKGPNSKFCGNCAPQQKKVAGQKRTDKKKATSFAYDSATEPSKAGR